MTKNDDGPQGDYYGYACPKTHEPLERVDAEHLKSPQTDVSYMITDGVPNFLSCPPEETSEVKENLNTLLKSAKELGCENALKQKEDDESLPYLMDESRAKYLDLLPFTRESKVLEIGASLGQHTRLIAERTSSVYALEIVEEQALFGDLWCSQLGHSGVKFAVGGDDCRLPYLDGLFDIVILNHVFEWCAGRADEDSTTVQKRMLSECQRILAPGGCLFLSTKNRFSARLLAGAKDPHVNLRFGNALPRWILKLLLRLQGKANPRGMLYSYNELKQMTLNSGFQRVETFWAVPDTRYPVQYIAHNPTAISQARKDTELKQKVDRLTRMLLAYAPDRLVAKLAPSHVFLAYKS